LYCVYVYIFVIYIEFFPYCLFVSNSQVIGCEDRLRNYLYCLGWRIKLYSIQSNPFENDMQRKCGLSLCLSVCLSICLSVCL